MQKVFLTSLALVLSLTLVGCGDTEQQPVAEQAAPPPEAPPVACTEEAKVCPDGRTVSRDPEHDCDFPSCPKPPQENESCAEDTKECPDGTALERDRMNYCQFPECPREEPIACAQDVQECSDGSFVSRDPEDDYAFASCPELADGDFTEVSSGAFQGSFSASGYVVTEEKTEAFCYPEEGEECEIFTYTFFVLQDYSSKDSVDQFLEQNTGNSFLREKAIGIGCLEDETLLYSNFYFPTNEHSPDREPLVSTEKSFSPVDTERLLNSSPEAPVTLEFEKLGFPRESSAPDCFSHFANIEIITDDLSTEPFAWTQDVQECPDGSFVARDPENDCAFRECLADTEKDIVLYLNEEYGIRFYHENRNVEERENGIRFGKYFNAEGEQIPIFSFQALLKSESETTAEVKERLEGMGGILEEFAIQGRSALRFEDIGICDGPTINIYGPEYVYQFQKHCGGFEELDEIVETVEFFEN